MWNRNRRFLQATALVAPVVLLAYLGWRYHWITDDGYIYLRIVSQIEAGNGPVFNAGQRVEAYTGPAWLGILALAHVVTRIDLAWLAVILGILFSALGALLATAAATRLGALATSSSTLVPGAGVLLLLGLFPMWLYESSGMETGLVFAWLGASCFLLAGWARAPDQPLSTSCLVLLGMGWLVRPELALFSAMFVVLVATAAWSEARPKERVRVVLAMLFAPAAYQLFRMGYFSSLVANTAIAKEASQPRWAQGWLYLKDFVEPYRLWIPIALLVIGAYVPLVAALRRGKQHAALLVVGAFVLGATLNALYVVRVGGDYLHARLLLPSLFALCTPVMAVPATRRYAACGLVAVWALVSAQWFRPYPDNETFLTSKKSFFAPTAVGSFVTLEQFGWAPGGPNWSWYRGDGMYFLANPFSVDFTRIDAEAAPEVVRPVAALYAIGLPGFALGPSFDVLDLLGLADAIDGRFELGELRGYPGHEKPMPAPWIAALLAAPGTYPSPDEFPVLPDTMIPRTAGAEFDEQVEWARAARRCPAIAELEQSTRAPMTAGLFLANVLRSVRHTRLRIPADPEVAYRRFCGPEVPREILSLRERSRALAGTP